MMHLCRDMFPSLLEEKGLLSGLLLSHFEPSHDLYDDIEKCDLIDYFVEYIYDFIDRNKKDKIKTD